MYFRTFIVAVVGLALGGAFSVSAQEDVSSGDAQRLALALVRGSLPAIVEHAGEIVDPKVMMGNPLVGEMPEAQQRELLEHLGQYPDLVRYVMETETGLLDVSPVSPALEQIITASEDIDVSEMLPGWANGRPLVDNIAEELGWSLLPEHMGPIAEFVESPAGQVLTADMMLTFSLGRELDLDDIGSRELASIKVFMETPAGQSFFENSGRIFRAVERQIDRYTATAALPLVLAFLYRGCEIAEIECGSVGDSRLYEVMPSPQ